MKAWYSSCNLVQTAFPAVSKSLKNFVSVNNWCFISRHFIGSTLDDFTRLVLYQIDANELLKHIERNSIYWKSACYTASYEKITKEVNSKSVPRMKQLYHSWNTFATLFSLLFTFYAMTLHLSVYGGVAYANWFCRWRDIASAFLKHLLIMLLFYAVFQLFQATGRIGLITTQHQQFFRNGIVSR